MNYDLLAFLVIGAAGLAVAAAVDARRLAPFPRRLFLLAVALRVVGSVARYEVQQRSYGGSGDAATYYDWGLRFATALWNGESPVWPEHWLGRHFLYRLSGPVVALIGPTMRGEFLIFSLLAFAGCYWMARGVAAAGPPADAKRFAAWLWLWPSLWFWPAGISKEAVMLCGLGLIVFGYAGRNGALRWAPYLAGLGICYLVRPHVTALVAVAAALASAFGALGVKVWRWKEAGITAVVALAVSAAASAYLDVGSVDDLREVIDQRAQATLYGGSQFGELPSGPTAVPRAFANVWLRPAPWEAHNAMTAVAAAEVLGLAGLAWFRRRPLLATLVAWRERRLAPLAVIALAGYTLMIGLFFGNQGLIVRQRCLAMPFMFLLLTAAPPAVPRCAQRRGGSLTGLLYIVTHPMTARLLLRGQLAYMAAVGFDVTLVAAGGEDLSATARREGVRAIALPLRREIAPALDALVLVRICWLLLRLRPTIVNASTPKAGFLGMIAARLTGVPIRIYTVRGLRLETTSGPRRLLLSATERVAAACAHRVLCISSSLRARYLELGLALESKLRVLAAGSSNGVAAASFPSSQAAAALRHSRRAALGIPENARVVGFVGRLTSDKGIVDLLQAFRLVREELADVFLLALGEFERGDPVPDWAVRALRIEERVVLPGFVADPTPDYCAMDVIVLPSYREGFCNVALEAATAGLPVVAYQTTGVSDAVVDGVTGRLVPRGDHQALARELLAHLEDPARRRREGEAGRHLVLTLYRPEEIWRALEGQYRRLLEARGLDGPTNRTAAGSLGPGRRAGGQLPSA